jgi:two-component system CheB/CheR fusion protein
LKDPPFSRIDLISCQNVMIYLESGPQKKILRSFHYALKPSGHLLLGKSETIGNASDLFSPADKQIKLFSKKAVSANFNFDFSIRSNFSLPETATDEERMIDEQDGEEDIEKEANKLLLTNYIPAAVTVNKDLHIISFHGNIARYLQPSSGKASLHLLKMIREDLAFELRGLIHQVKKEGQAVAKDNIEAIPLRTSSKHPYYLVLFRESPPPALLPEAEERTEGAKKDRKDKKISVLSQELKMSREQMKAMGEEFEAVREELQSANEEILSSNEELQSINEELETSKEELQSANEELTTINEELLVRNVDLKESVDYTEAIIETVREPLVVLNADLRVVTANKAFYTLFKIRAEETEGNTFYEMGNGVLNMPGLKKQLGEIISKNKSFQNFELIIPGPAAENKILLFNAMRINRENDKRNRFLLVIDDISDRRRTEETIRQSNMRYETFIALSTEGICRFEIDKPLSTGASAQEQIEQLYKYARVAECNEAMAIMNGYAGAGEMVGARFEDLSLPHTERKQYLTKFIESEYRLSNEEISILDRSGKERYFLNNLTGIVVSGRLKRIWVIQRDITEKKAFQNDLIRSEERFRRLVQNAFDIITIYSETGNIKYQSESVERILGYSPSERVGTNVFEQPYVHPDDMHLKREMFKRCIASPDEPIRTQFRLQHKSGQYRTMEVVCQNLLNNKQINGLVANYRDITDKAALDKQKEEFIGIASHELKTPITSIKGYTQIIRNSLLESQDMESVRLVERMDKQVNRLTNLVKDLLDVTRITGGELRLTMKPFDVNALITDAVDEIQPSIPKHKIETDLKASTWVLADWERTSQVVSNLLSNAGKYSPDSDKILIRSSSDDKNITVSVEDFGIGISKESMKKIFQQFFRVHDDKVSTYPGLGLGLYISAQLIKRQNGILWVESVLGKGSVFHFSLPIAVPTANPTAT